MPETLKARGKAKAPKPTGLFLEYQTRWVHDLARLKIAEKSRQIGWTWATAHGLVRRKSKAGAALDAWISSRDDIQARLFLEDCKQFAGILQAGAKDFGQLAIDAAGNTAYVLQFANGLRLHSMSSNPDAQAGKRGDRVLDEFALHPDPRRLYAIAYPGITWGGSMEIFSTHRGTANFFNELVQEVKHKGNPKGFSFHRVTLQDALEQGFLHKLQGKLPAEDPRQEMDEAGYFDFIRRGCPDEETFQQEYCCNPSDDNSAFLSYDLIQGCEYRAGEEWELPLRDLTDLYLGVDVGREHDLTVMWLLQRLGSVLYTRRVTVMQGQDFDAQEAELYALLSLPGLRRACIDATGLGKQFAERAKKRFGTYRVEPVTFTLQVKEDLAYPLLLSFQDRGVRIPGDMHVRADLRAVKKMTTAAGNIRFQADRGPGGHADRFWALALAIEAAKAAEGGGVRETAGIVVGQGKWRPGQTGRFQI